MPPTSRRSSPGYASTSRRPCGWSVTVWAPCRSGISRRNSRDATGREGIVLTSTILRDAGDRPVPAMELETLRIPVLVVHHERDGCRFCLFRDLPALMDKLDAVPVKELIAVTGGVSSGDPCTAFAHHGYNGIERAVVARITGWIVSR